MVGRGIWLVLVVLLVLPFSLADTLTITGTQNSDYIDGEVSSSTISRTTDSSVSISNTPSRVFFDFNTSDIPDGATIDSVTLNLTIFSEVMSGDVDMYALAQKGDTYNDGADASGLYSACAGGNGAVQVLSNSAGTDGTGEKSITLTSAAETRLENNLSADFFTVCVKLDDEVSFNVRDIRTFESSGNEPSITVNYTTGAPDTTSPTITINTPTNDSTVNIASQVVNITLNENGTANLSLDGGSTNLTMDSDDNQLFNRTITLSEGSNTIDVYVADDAGNTNQTQIQITLDSTPPTITINSPTNESTVGPNVNLDFTTNENATGNYSVDGGANTSLNEVTITNLNASLVLATGAYIIDIFIADSYTNLNQTTLSITVDATEPEITINEPANNSIVTDPLLFINISLNENGTVLVNRNETGNVSLNTTDNQYFNGTITLEQGDNPIVIYTEDDYGNTNQSSINVTLDSSAPNITINSPTNGSTVNTASQIVNITLNEIGSANLSLNGAANQTMDSSDSLVFNRTLTLTEGVNTIEVFTADSNGNTNQTTIEITLDSVSPNITINSPTNESNVSNPIQILNITLNETGSVNVSLNGGANVSLNTSDNLNFNGSFTLTEGTNTFDIYARDQANNTNQSYFELTLDTIGPDITINDPANNSLVLNALTEINITLSEVGLVNVSVNGGTNITLNTSDSVIHYGNVTLAEGVNLIDIFAFDQLNNSNQSNLNITLDSSSPSITINDPTNNSIVTTQPLLVNITLDQTGSANVSVNGGANITLNTSDNLVFIGNVTLAENENTIDIFVADTNGNTNQSNLNVSLDTTPPNITINEPTNNSVTTSSSSVINITLNQTGSANVSLNSGANISLNTSDSLTFNGSFTLTEGTNIFDIFVADTNGNQNGSSLQVILDTTAPAITIDTPPNNTITNDSSLTINITLDQLGSANVSVNGGANQSMTTGDNVNFTQPVTLTEGTNTIEIFVVDNVSNRNQTSLNVTLDTTLPILTFNDPTNNSQIVNFPYLINITSNEQLSVANFSYDGTNYSMSTSDNLTFTYNLNSIATQDYNFTITGMDLAGNINSTTINVSANATAGADTAPTVNLISPNASTENEIPVVFSYGAGDSHNLTNCTLYGNFSGAFIANETTTFSGASTYDTYNFSLNLTDGFYEWNVLCSDNSSNLTFADNNATFTLAATTPQLQEVSLASTGGTNLTDENLECSANIYDFDNSSVTITHTWYRNGVFFDQNITSHNTGSLVRAGIPLSSANTSKTETWICQISATDGTFSSTTVNSTALTILNAEPSLSVTSISIDQDTNTTTNLTDATTDIDGDTVTFAILNETPHENVFANITDGILLTVGNGSYAGTVILELTLDDGSGIVYRNISFTLNAPAPPSSGGGGGGGGGSSTPTTPVNDDDDDPIDTYVPPVTTTPEPEEETTPEPEEEEEPEEPEEEIEEPVKDIILEPEPQSPLPTLTQENEPLRLVSRSRDGKSTYRSKQVGNPIINNETKPIIQEIFAEVPEEVLNKTKECVNTVREIEVGEGTTKINVVIDPECENAELEYYEVIPKCVIELIQEGKINESVIKFDNTNFKVIEEDPVIMWQFEEQTSPIELDYEVSKEVLTDCLEQLEGYIKADGLGDPLGPDIPWELIWPPLLGVIIVGALLYGESLVKRYK